MIANIMVPLDGSQLAERALPYAARLAKAAQAHLHLFHVMPDIPPPVHAWAELDVAARLETLATQLRGQGIQATARTVVGRRPATTILSNAADPPADLIVMSTHGMSGIGRWLYGSVADEILAKSDLPVLLVPAACRHPWPQDRPLKLMVPLDGSDLSEAALEPAKMLGKLLGSQLVLTRIVEPNYDIAAHIDLVGMTFKRAASEDLGAAEEYLRGIADPMIPTGQQVDVLVDEGDPASTIAAIARQESADLIVMATHGRTGLGRLTMGSVATATVQRAHTPLLLVRPPGLARPAAEPVAAPAVTAEEEAVMNAWPPVGTR
jgi:nucleotide-binding universal stress UspA family protein